MSSSASTALVGLALLAGCPGSQAAVCDNGVVCPEGTLCTENVRSECGQPFEVEACVGKQQFESCEFLATQGSCVDGICTECNRNLSGCRYPGPWRPMSSPIGEELAAVWVGGPAVAFAVGGNGQALRYDGTDWQPIVELTAITAKESLTEIWGIADPLELFVGGGGGTVVYHYRDGTWSKELLPGATTGAISALGGFSRNSVYAAGLGLIWKYDGVAWAPFDPGAGTSNVRFNGVWVRDANELAVVGSDGAGVIRRFNGTGWTDLGTSEVAARFESLDAIWGADDHLFAVGQLAFNEFSPALVHVVPSGVTVVEVPGGNQGMTGVWGTGASDIFIVGGGGDIEHSDNVFATAPTPMETPNRSTRLEAISGWSPTDVIAVGEAGALWRYDGP